jgi:hypothetical protein
MLPILTAPSAEEEACARELAAQRACVLRAHAAVATDRTDRARLLAAADAATVTARRSRS